MHCLICGRQGAQPIRCCTILDLAHYVRKWPLQIPSNLLQRDKAVHDVCIHNVDVADALDRCYQCLDLSRDSPISEKDFRS